MSEHNSTSDGQCLDGGEAVAPDGDRLEFTAIAQRERLALRKTVSIDDQGLQRLALRERYGLEVLEAVRVNAEVLQVAEL